MPLSSLSSPARRLAALALLPPRRDRGSRHRGTNRPGRRHHVTGGDQRGLRRRWNSGAQFSNDFIGSTTTGPGVRHLDVVRAVRVLDREHVDQPDEPHRVHPGEVVLPRPESAGATPSGSLPTPDVIGTIAMSATAGKVALVSNQTNLACGADCDGSAGVVDFVGYGAANDFAAPRRAG